MLRILRAIKLSWNLTLRRNLTRFTELNPQSEVYSDNFPKFQGQKNPLSWTRELREVDDVIQIPVDNYQAVTLAAIKHRSEIIESVDDDDEIEWTEDHLNTSHNLPPQFRR